MSVIFEEAEHIAAQCRHYAMCKIDFLGTGLCPSGKKNGFVSYYPQGRMDIYYALSNNMIPVTPRLIDIVNTCTLCGICDKQCYFVTELRPMKVMNALKYYLDDYLKAQGEIVRCVEDGVLKQLREIVGGQWATNDPAILISYANDPCPLTEMKMPSYVVMPRTQDEIRGIVALCKENYISYEVRGNGSSVIGLVFTDGVVIDMGRMSTIEIDRENWCVHVEPGVSAYELQKEVYKHGFRVNAGEPSALVCANIMCSGVFSLFSNAYGTAADNYINAEFVDGRGEVFELNQKTAPNLFGFQHQELPSPGICTKAAIKLHPITEDEEGVLIPFANFDDAVCFSRDLCMRRIGIAIGIIGKEYTATFMSPASELAERLKDTLSNKLGLDYSVLVIGDRYAIETIRRMGLPIIDNSMLRMVMLSLPEFTEGEWVDLIDEAAGDRQPYEFLCKEEMQPLLEAVLDPSPGHIGGAVVEDMRDFFTRLYAKPEMTDIVWLNMFRIVSARMGRYKHVLALVVYLPLDNTKDITALNSKFKDIADTHGIRNDFGFLTPIDTGKRAVLEYDYYISHTDRLEVAKSQEALREAGEAIERMAADRKGVVWIKYLLHQGFARKEQFLYM
ncbi:MAG: FAD-binding oxidoreductase [Thermodesulfobacteriota bacterium]